MRFKKLAAALACVGALAFPASALAGHGPPHISPEVGDDNFSLNVILGEDGNKLHIVCHGDASEQELECDQKG
jgi:hypothetical protein